MLLSHQPLINIKPPLIRLKLLLRMNQIIIPYLILSKYQLPIIPDLPVHISVHIFKCPREVTLTVKIICHVHIISESFPSLRQL